MQFHSSGTAAALVVIFGLGAVAPASAQDNLMTVFKTPTCGCCTAWAEEMTKLGFEVETVDLDDLTQVKQQAGVPEILHGCHTAVLGDYILEGHVPEQAITMLLQERPDIRGISTPGMPMGALGMGYDPDAKYTVFAFFADASQEPEVFYQVGQ